VLSSIPERACEPPNAGFQAPDAQQIHDTGAHDGASGARSLK